MFHHTYLTNLLLHEVFFKKTFKTYLLELTAFRLCQSGLVTAPGPAGLSLASSGSRISLGGGANPLRGAPMSDAVIFWKKFRLAGSGAHRQRPA